MKRPRWRVHDQVRELLVAAVDYYKFDMGDCAEAVAAAKGLANDADISAVLPLA
jgi:hypothetical protein